MLDCLLKSCQVACAFSSRPGLQALVLKVGALEPFTPHLLRQATASVRLYLRCLLSLCCVDNDRLAAWYSGNKVADDAETIVKGKPRLLVESPAPGSGEEDNPDENGKEEEVEMEDGDDVRDRVEPATVTNPEPRVIEHLAPDFSNRPFDQILVWLKSRQSEPSWLWVASRAALVTQRVVDYIAGLHGRPPGHVSPSDLNEDKDSTSIASAAIHSVLMPESRLAWQKTELNAWSGVMSDVFGWMCTMPPERLRCFLPAFYPACVELLPHVRDERTVRAMQAFFRHVGAMNGWVS